MQRRTVLRGLAALAAGAGAGCTGANREVPATAAEPPAAVRESKGGDGGDGNGGSGGGDGNDGSSDEPALAVPDRTFRAADDGDLVVVVTVENRGEAPQEAVMTVTVAAGDKTFSPVRHVVLDPGASRQYEIAVPVPHEEFQADPGFDVRFEPGPPDTPVPEGTVTPYPEDRETPTATATRTATETPTTADTTEDAAGSIDRSTDETATE